MTWLNVLIHLAIMAYAVRAICVRLRDSRIGKDRRIPKADHVIALQVGFTVTMLMLALALMADATDGGKRYAYVRISWELVEILCVVVTGLSLRVLQHCRRMAPRTKKQEQHPRGVPNHGRS